MSLVDRAISEIESGRAGNNVGIPIAFDKLREHIPDIQKKHYTLIGAETKVGKTSFADDIYLYGVWDYLNNNSTNIIVDIDYYSFEISAEAKIIKGISRQLWKEYGIIADAKTILSKGKNYCSDELYDLVRKSLKYYEGIDSILTIHSVDNPTGISKYLWDKALKHGKVHKKNIQQDPDGSPIWRFDYYEPYNKDRYWIVIIDHAGLTLEEQGKSIKQTMDLLSGKLVAARNNFGLTVVVIQQLSFEVANDERFKSNRLTPTLRDFSDSRYLSRDADVIMALFSPAAYQLSKFHGYDITKLGDSYRNCEILRNRDGEPNINFGFNFIGPCGTFRELPRPDQMTDTAYKHASEYINGKSVYVKNEKDIYVKRSK